MSFSGGKGSLKLKGDDSIKKKKRKKKGKELAVIEDPETSVDPKETPEGVFLEPPPKDADRRTAAERRFDEQMEKREAERIAKMTSKSHRQRVAEFNEHLGKLTEHMDIPKVGPG